MMLFTIHWFSNSKAMLRKQSEMPLAPDKRKPGVPKELNDLCMALLEIDPADSEWCGHVDDVRGTLESLSAEAPGNLDAAHILEAHRKLCEASDENAGKFSAVLDVLEKRAVGE